MLQNYTLTNVDKQNSDFEPQRVISGEVTIDTVYAYFEKNQ